MIGNALLYTLGIDLSWLPVFMAFILWYSSSLWFIRGFAILLLYFCPLTRTFEKVIGYVSQFPTKYYSLELRKSGRLALIKLIYWHLFAKVCVGQRSEARRFPPPWLTKSSVPPGSENWYKTCLGGWQQQFDITVGNCTSLYSITNNDA